MTDPQDDLLELGDDFEILDGDSVSDESLVAPSEPAKPVVAAVEPAAVEALVSEPAVAAKEAKKPHPPQGNPNLPSSAVSWHGVGSLMAFAGLLASWNQAGNATLLHGLALVFVLREFLRFGLGAARPVPGPDFQPKKPWIYPAGPLSLICGIALLVTGAASLPSGFVLLGGLFLLAAPFLAKKKDAKRAPTPEPQTDVSFEKSLVGYLAVLVGLFLPWCSSGVLGLQGLGIFVFLFVLVAAWASRAGVWKSWTFPLVTSSAKVGGLLFMAPLLADLYGMAGLLRHFVADAFGGALSGMWPSVEGVDDSFLQYGAGPMLVFAGAILATIVLVRGAKEAQVVAGERKKAEIEARKANRAARKKKA